jgi:osmotically-inducible protein OsmY
VLFAAGVATARLASYLDKRRRHIARDRAAAATRDLAHAADRRARYAAGIVKGALQETATPLRREQREYDDVTLARKVESELFRPADAPKDAVSINVHNGIVELRGQVKRPEDVKQLEAATAKIEGVKRVHNLLHTPGSPPKHSPAGQSR